jgi:16S rRNA G966 N2-methylase RsmD
VDRYLRRSVGKEQADLIFADPPYDPEGSGTRLQKTLHLISQRSILHPAGCLVYEQGLNEPIVEVRGWCLDRAKTYGKTQLLYYQLDPMRYTETIS